MFWPASLIYIKCAAHPKNESLYMHNFIPKPRPTYIYCTQNWGLYHVHAIFINGKSKCEMRTTSHHCTYEAAYCAAFSRMGDGGLSLFRSLFYFCTSYRIKNVYKFQELTTIYNKNKKNEKRICEELILFYSILKSISFSCAFSQQWICNFWIAPCIYSFDVFFI